MRLLRKKRSDKVGLPPGTPVLVGVKRTEKVNITIIDYDQKDFNELKCEKIDQCFPFLDKPTTTWVNIDGIVDPMLIEKIGDNFNLHPLVREDIMNTEQRPKVEDFGDYMFIILKMLYFDEKTSEIVVEQVSLILGPNYVISFQEREGDVFDIIRKRLMTGKGRIRKEGADYLAYTLMDAIIDHYFIILEKIGEIIEDMEEELVAKPTPETLQTIHKLKSELIYLRKSVWPLREVISNLQRSESRLIKKNTTIYLRDVYDHTIQVMDTVETFRDMTSGMLDIYLSSISNKMNEIMKVLTIIATIFIPLTFIAGVYGMNFQYMPELGLQWAYPLVWIVMLGIGISMLFYFRRKKWL